MRHVKGALVSIESKIKPVNAYVSFNVLLSTIDSIKIVGKVVRHTQHQGKDAMGIAILELSSKDLSNWLNFLGGIREDGEAIPIRTTDQNTLKNKNPNFTIKFLTRAKLKQFFPSSLRDEFYFTTTRAMNPGQEINLTLLHPDNDNLLHLLIVVQRYGDHPTKKGKQGLYCKFVEPNLELKQNIQNFV
ncbi:MAG: hypothetical protein R3A45_07560 [Bdellovibrionota bacterium]